MTRDEWLQAFAEEAGLTRPDTEQIRDLLELAATAAHASERTAAPLACWMAGRSGLEPSELLAAAARVGTQDGADQPPAPG